ncbi:unnamed protein product, partial [marine sediment metagenome]
AGNLLLGQLKYPETMRMNQKMKQMNGGCDMNENADQKIYLNGYIDVPIDRIAAVKTALTDHIARTRAEEGCISFDVVASDEIDGRFMVSEIFINQTAFDAHQKRTKNSDWYKTTEGIPREYSIRVGEQ